MDTGRTRTAAAAVVGVGIGLDGVGDAAVGSDWGSRSRIRQLGTHRDHRPGCYYHPSG